MTEDGRTLLCAPRWTPLPDTPPLTEVLSFKPRIDAPPAGRANFIAGFGPPPAPEPLPRNGYDQLTSLNSVGPLKVLQSLSIICRLT